MPVVNPLVQGGLAAGGQSGGYAPPPESPRDMAPTAPSHGSSGFSLGTIEGGFTNPDNTSAHVAVAVVIMFSIVLGLKAMGFRWGVDAGVAGG